MSVKRKGRIAAMIAAGVMFLASAAVSAYMILRPSGNIVEIISGGEVLYTLDLSQEEDRDITIEYEGRKNLVRIEAHDIYVIEAECPDHTCVKTGKLSKAGVPIVCLPNKLMIKYKNGNGGDTDAAA